MTTTNRFFNPKQLEAMSIAAKDEYIIASRGFGKSEGIDAPRLIRNVFAMPRSAGGLLSPTYGKLLRNTLPAVFHALNRLGYLRDVHYVVGKKPDKKLDFAKPLIDPLSYDYVIAWFNGSIQNLLSFDRNMSANSMSLDYIMGFEAKYLNHEKIKNEVIPTLRGNTNHFGKCPWHHGILFTSDMPTTKSGKWLLEKEKDMDIDLINLIKLTYKQYKKATSAEWKKRLFKELQEYRSKATFYAEYDAFDNLEILGEDFIKKMERNLPPLVFASAILNKRHSKITNGFYAALNQEIHCYESYNNQFLESLNYDTNLSNTETCLKDADIDPAKPLAIALDYNAAICNLVVGQKTSSKEARTLKQFFVKTPRKIKDLINDFSDYYQPHPNRDIIYFFDSTAVAQTPADATSFAEEVISTLEKRGWNVLANHIGQPLAVHLRHFYIDLALKGDTNYLFPTFNADNTEYLILAMETTGTKIGEKGFTKDKSAEKKMDTPEEPDELKTHVTDAWDTLFIGLNFHYTTPSTHSNQLTHFPTRN